MCRRTSPKKIFCWSLSKRRRTPRSRFRLTAFALPSTLLRPFCCRRCALAARLLRRCGLRTCWRGFRRVTSGGVAEKAYWSERVPLERLFEVHIAPSAVRPLLSPDALLTIKDLTEAKKLERMRADFIANASHELRTPLASMLGFIETLQGPAREDRVAREKFLRIMADQGRRMARLIEDLLSLSRIEQNQYVRPSSQADLAQIAQHVRSLSPLANEKGVSLRCESANATIVLGDRDELVRVAET